MTMSLPENDDQILLLHNPRCSKSRAVHEILRLKEVEFEVRPYLEEPLSPEELSDLEGRLGRPIGEWVRPKESAWAEAGTTAEAAREVLIEAVAQHPILMERPIVVRGSKAKIGRPPEDVHSLLD